MRSARIAGGPCRRSRRRDGPATRRRSGRTRRLAEAVLGWRASHGLDAIVETAWRWHSTHPDGYGPESAETPVAVAERR